MEICIKLYEIEPNFLIYLLLRFYEDQGHLLQGHLLFFPNFEN